MTTYTHTTFATSKTLLSTRLDDASKVHWLDAELGLYIREAIRVYNTMTGLHRVAVPFTTSPGVAFYDLSTVAGPATYRLYSQTDANSITPMKHMLLESPMNSNTGVGITEMWAFADWVDALQKARDQFIADTGCVLTPEGPFVVAGGEDSFSLNDDVTSVRRAVWVDQFGNYTTLWPTDESMIVTANLTPGTPTGYSVITKPELTVRLSPTPLASGSVYLYATEAGAVLVPTANANAGTVLGIPNDSAWGVRFKAMSILLRKDGQARDAARATYCEDLYNLSVDIARTLPVILNVYIDGRQVIPTTLARLDGLNLGWEGKGTGTPETLAIAGPSLIALNPIPDSNPHSVLLELVCNALVPVVDTDFLQIPREDLDGILSWAEMLACFKSQGDSLENARIASKKMVERASLYNDRRVQQSSYLREMLQQSTNEMADRPLYGPSDAVSSTEGDRRDSASGRQSRSRSLLTRSRKRLGGR